MADEILSSELRQIDPSIYYLPAELEDFRVRCSNKGIDTIFFEKNKIFSRPQVAMRIDANSRELICKLLAMQITKKDRVFLFSVSPDGNHIYLSIADEKIGQSQRFIKELVTDMDRIDEAVIDDNVMKNADALIKFAENKDFIPFKRTKGADVEFGYIYEADSNSQIVTFYNERLYEDNIRSRGEGKIVRSFTIPFDRISEEYLEKALIYGPPKDTSKLTDEEYEIAAKVWSEGNPELMKTLMLARKLNIKTAGCCSGHNFETYGPQINFIIDNQESAKIIGRLLALKIQNKENVDEGIYTSDDSTRVSIMSKKDGYDEEFFKVMNEQLESIAQGKENPNTRMMDALYMWMNSNLYRNISRCVWFNCEKQTIDNGERNPIIHPISVLKEMIDESHSLEEFDGKMGELFPIRTISSQEMKQTTDNIVSKGLKESSFKSFLTGLLQKLGLKSKDEHDDIEQ